MKVDDILKAALKDLKKYDDLLGTLDEEKLQKTPAAGVWSYSEVYSHIFQVNLRCFIAIDRCAESSKSSSGKLQLSARIVLFLGMFPFRIKAPAKIAAMVQKITKDEAVVGIKKLEAKLIQVASVVNSAPPNAKIEHPRLGMLNAVQWLRFIEIHNRHHLKQIKRLKKMLEKD
jgi:hypothetical protein